MRTVKRSVKALSIMLCLVTFLAFSSALFPLTASAATVGDFTVEGGTENTDYTYADNVLTILTSTQLTVSGTTTAARIVIAENTSANLTISGLSIQITSGNAIDLSTGSTLNLTLDGANTLYPGGTKAGIHVPGGTTLTISGNGSLDVRGGRSGSDGGAGIGANKSGTLGVINIQSGTITAKAASGGGAGIGMGGWGGSSTNASVTVSGGYVTSTGAGDEGSFYGGTIAITGGVVITPDTKLSSAEMSNCLVFQGNAGQVYETVTLPDNFTVENEKSLTVPEGATLNTGSYTLTNNGIIHVVGTIDGTLINSGTINQINNATLPEGIGGTISTYDWKFGNLLVKGGAINTDFSYADNVLTISTGTSLTISGTTTADRIVIAESTTANLTIHNLSIDIQNGNAIDISSGSTLNLTLSGSNTLCPGGTKAGIHVPDGTTLKVSGEGSLEVYGGRSGSNGGAAIGANQSGTLGIIEIQSGTITAKAAGGSGAGIGMGGSGGSSTNASVTISGGYVTSTGVGGEGSFYGGTIEITGGVVITPDTKLSSAKMNNCIVFQGDAGRVYGTVALSEDFTVENTKSLTVPEDATLNTGAYTLTNNGIIHVVGTINGTLTNNGTINVSGTINGTLNNSGEIYQNEDATVPEGTEGIIPTNGWMCGDLWVTGGKYDIDFLYANNVVTILTNTQLTISGTTAADRIVIAENTTANLTINDLSIDIQNGNAIDISSGSTLNLTLSGSNTLRSGGTKAGIHVPNGTTLKVSGEGSLEVYGGRSGSGGAAIGANQSGTLGKIEIQSGTITAKAAGGGGAGIGMGGWGGSSTNASVTISGGYVISTGAGAEGSFNGGTIAITGGVVVAPDTKLSSAEMNNCIVFQENVGRVYGIVTLSEDFTVENTKSLIVPEGATLSTGSYTLTNNGIIHVFGSISGTLINNGTINVSGTINGTLNNSGEIYQNEDATVPDGTDGITTTNGWMCGDLLVTGGKFEIDYFYANNVVTILTNTQLTVSGTTTADRIVVGASVNANVILNGVSITQPGGSPFTIPSGSSATITLAAGTTNTLIGSNDCAGLNVPSGATITINCGNHPNGDCDGGTNCGKLMAKGSGGYNGKGPAGIGGSLGQGAGNITISGGSVTATGGEFGAGVGGGDHSSGGNITISGGTVTATGGYSGAGIGGGAYGSGGTITISGGTVITTGGNHGAGIGGGAGSGASQAGSGGNITISGGTVTATSGGYGAGIGGGGSNGWYSGGSGSFSTGNGGNVVIVASSISDKTNESTWNGVILQGNTGAIYGTSVSPTENFEVPTGKTLTIANGQTLTVAEGITLTNNGTIVIEEGGALVVNGTLGGTGTVKNAVSISFNAGDGSGTMDSVTAYTTETYTLPECTFTAPDGYKFKAWSVGGTEYAVGESFTVTADTTVTAVWEAEVISVTITWGAMEFTYTEEWNPESHEYDSGEWSANNASNYITVQNNGNVTVTAGFEYVAGTVTGITATFKESDTVITTTELAPQASKTVYLTLSGTPSSKELTQTVIGTVKVTITKATQ